MTHIYFRKILKYDPTINGKYSKYVGYSKITSQEIDPGIEFPIEHSLNIPPSLEPTVFSSKLLRSVQTVNQYFNEKEIIYLKELNEIQFELTSLLSKKEYEEEGSNLVRQRFIEAFIEDNLVEKRRETQARMDQLIKNFSSLKSGNYLVVSHSFFMKLLDIYLKNRNLFQQPTIIRKHFDFREKTFEFGEGFDFLI